jgi:hypothetical protein
MSTRNLPLGGEGGRCLGLTTLPPSCADNSDSLSLLYLYRPVEAFLCKQALARHALGSRLLTLDLQLFSKTQMKTAAPRSVTSSSQLAVVTPSHRPPPLRPTLSPLSHRFGPLSSPRINTLYWWSGLCPE